MPLKILLIEDSELDTELTLRAFRKSDLDSRVTVIDSMNGLEEELNSRKYDLVISDYNLSGFTGEDTFNLVREKQPGIPFIVQSGEINKKMEVNLLKNQVTDVVLKSNVARLPFAVRRALNEKEDRDRLEDNLKIQNALSEISILFDSDKPLSDKIDEALGIIGETADASRVYVFEDYDNQRKSRNTHEWVAEHAVSQRDKIVDLDYEQDVPEWKSLVGSGKHLKVENVNVLSESFKKILLPQDIKSILVYPILIDRKPVGFIGMSDTLKYRKWPDYLEKMMISVSGFIAHAYKEQQYINTLEQSNIDLQEALDEKNVLIAEIHHRVKNNLALISSFLELERFKTKNPEIQSLISSNLHKIKSIARIQEQLYASNSFTKVPVGVVLYDLIGSLATYFAGQAKFVFHRKEEEVILNVNQASPLVLFVSELFSEMIPRLNKERDAGEPLQFELACNTNDDQFILKICNPELCQFFKNLNTLAEISEIAQVLTYQLEADVQTIPERNELSISFEKREKKGSSSSL